MHEKFCPSIVILCLFFAFQFTIGQEDKWEYSFSTSGSGYINSGEELPFWLYTNSNGAIADNTSYLVTAGGTINYALTKGLNLEAKASLFLRDGVRSDKLQREEMYVQLTSNWFRITVGSKNPIERFNDLSIVQKNFLLSGNSRAVPGLYFGVNAPQRLVANLYYDFGIGHYLLNDNRFVANTNLHYKHIGLQWQVSKKSELRLGLEHYAQWNGVSPTLGPQPDDFSDFINVFFAQKANEDAFEGEQVNALGNHLGIYSIEFKHHLGYGSLRVYHQHPFEDGSGTALKNFPDGIWGLYYELNQDNYTGFLKGILLEYIHTLSQSGRFGRSAVDNYFNNTIYRSGWTYEGNVIGIPLIGESGVSDPYLNNRFYAIHLGALAGSKKLMHRVKVTYVDDYGHYVRPYSPTHKSIRTSYTSTYRINASHEVGIAVGFDYYSAFEERYGAGVKYRFILE